MLPCTRNRPFEFVLRFFQPPNDVRIYFVILDCLAACNEQSVDLPAGFAISFVRGDRHSAIRRDRPMRGSAYYFDGINRSGVRMLSRENFRGAGKDLQRPNQIEHFRPGRGDKRDSSRDRRSVYIAASAQSVLSAVTN